MIAQVMGGMAAWRPATGQRHGGMVAQVARVKRKFRSSTFRQPVYHLRRRGSRFVWRPSDVVITMADR